LTGKGYVVGEQGGDTTVRILLDVWPSRKLEDWEIDGVVSRCTSHLLKWSNCMVV
jgi:hypothetical protein